MIYITAAVKHNFADTVFNGALSNYFADILRTA